MRSATPHSQKLKLQIAFDAQYQDIFLLSALHNVSESGYPYYEFFNVRNYLLSKLSEDSLLKR